MTVYPCSACGGQRFQRIGTAGLYSRRTTVQVCMWCGLACLNPRWTEAEYRQYYAQDYQRSVVLPADDAPRDLALLALIASCVPAAGAIADVGAGAGGLLRTLARRGWSTLTAVEPEPRARAALRAAVPGATVVDAVPPSSHDAIVLSHVLEHFVDPVASLTALRDGLRADGALIVVVPANWGPTPHREFTVPHTHYFTAGTLAAVVRRAGFTVERLRSQDGQLWLTGRLGAVIPAQPDPVEVGRAIAKTGRIAASERRWLWRRAVLQRVMPERVFWQAARLMASRRERTVNRRESALPCPIARAEAPRCRLEIPDAARKGRC